MREFLDPVVQMVNNIYGAFTINGDTPRPVELPLRYPVATPFIQEGSIYFEYFNLVTSTVGNVYDLIS